MTKGRLHTRTIKSIEYLSEFTPSVKGDKRYDDFDTFVYIVNFDYQEGFAVLSADDRISSMIIAVTENGELHPEDFLNVYDLREKDTLIHYTDSLGIARVMGRYNAEEDDYYVATQDNPKMIAELIYDYIQDEYTGKVGDERTGSDAEEKGNRGYNSGDNQPNSNAFGDENQWGENTVWVTKKSVPMMLSTLWSQSSSIYQYNKYCPRVFGGKGIVGCVPLAVAQIMTYHKYPSGLTSGETIINYDTLQTVHPYGAEEDFSSENAKDMLAKFLRKVGKACNAIYVGHEFTFSLSKWAKTALKNYGYENVKNLCRFKQENIVNMLDSGNPVFMLAMSGNSNGHAWVIDGYRYQERILPNSGQVIDTRLLLHCNWGWNGKCNGYFAYKVFKPKQQPEEFEDEWEEQYDLQFSNDRERRYFKWWFRIITYSNPFSL